MSVLPSDGLISLRKSVPDSFLPAYQSVNRLNHVHQIRPRTHSVAGVEVRSFELVNSHAIDESPLLDRLVDDCERDDVVFDVGANIGTYSLVLAQQLTDGTVFAFEPVRSVFRRMQANLAVGTRPGTSYPVNVALSDENGRDTIHTGSKDRFSTLSSTVATVRDLSGETTITKRRLDELDLPTPNVLKVDTEGHELKVLRGAEGVLESARPRVYVEPHDVEAYNRSDLVEFFETRSYTVERDADFLVAHPN